MISKTESDYTGPTPTDINDTYSLHTYDLVTCLVNGEQKRSIQTRYLLKFGYTRETYLEKFPGAPLMSLASRERYTTAARTESGRHARSENLKKLNLHNSVFQQKRKDGVMQFWDSDKSHSRRSQMRETCLSQHKNGLEDDIRAYFNDRYVGSDDQKNRSKRLKENNPSHNPETIKKSKATWLKNHNANKHFVKNKFRDTDLSYQSGLEYKFLQECERNNILNRIKNAPTLNDAEYPRQFYVPDFLLDDEYIIEIKSWYIEKKQLDINPLVTIEKQELVLRSGYKWLYIKDNDLVEFISVVGIGS